MMIKLFLRSVAAALICGSVLVNQTSAQSSIKQVLRDRQFAILEYPDVAKEYMGTVLSFDSLFEVTDHTPEFHYYHEGSERLSSVHELIRDAADGSVIEIPEGEYTSEYFVMENRHNITLRAKPGTAWLISDNNLSTIFYLVNCTNVTLQGIGFLHRTGGFCAGNSIEIRGCRNIVLDSCDISGSGTIGVFADFVDSLVIKNSYVHHCSYQMMSLYNVRNAVLFNNLFTDNRESMTITEGVTVGNVWGKCIIQNNSFYRNACAALVFEISKQDDRKCPVGNGYVYVMRNLFYDNYSPAKSASIFDVFCDDMWGEYAVPAGDMVSFRENVFNTFSDAPADDEAEDLSGEYYYLYPETVVGDFKLDGNFFKDLSNRGYSLETDSFVVGVHSSAVNWLPLSRNPEEN